jgi:hypothetical protein
MTTMEPTFDATGYPTDETLDAIANWPPDSFDDLMRFVISAWHPTGHVYRARGFVALTTGGWSGNESIIDALESNQLFWSRYWSHIMRGGKYCFAVQLGDPVTPFWQGE